MKKVKIFIFSFFFLLSPVIGLAEEGNNDYTSQGKVSFYGKYIPNKKEEIRISETSDAYQTVGKYLPATGDQNYIFYYLFSGLLLLISLKLLHKQKKNQSST